MISVPGDGMCFLTCMQICLEWDFNQRCTLTEIKDNILDEIVEHLDFYSEFHHDLSKGQVVHDCMKYLTENKYMMDIVDVVVMACTNALGVNLYILSHTGSDALMVTYTTHIPTNKNIFLKYNRHGGEVHGTDHYSAIADKLDICTSISSKPKQSQSESQTETNPHPIQSSIDQDSNTSVGSRIDKEVDKKNNPLDASDDADTYFDEYGSQIDCMQTEKSFAVEDDIIIADPQGMLFGNISQVEGPVGSQN